MGGIFAPVGVGGSALTALCLLLGCGGSSAPPESPSPAAEPTTQTEREAPPQVDEEAPATSDTSSENADTDVAEEPEAEREVIYRVAPEGLTIDVDGVRFLPSAKAVKQKDGTWGIEIIVDAKSRDDRIHTVLSPREGALAVAGYVEKKNGTQEPFGDTRDGEDEEFITPGQPTQLTRTWKGGGKVPLLLWGEKVKLQVGLWGLGTPETRRRPVKKMFEVTMVSGAKPRPVVSPPQVQR